VTSFLAVGPITRRLVPRVEMFKEVVSLAIILGFIWNVLFIAHPNKSTYTISFILSLLALSPFAVLWRYLAASRDSSTLGEREEVGEVLMGFVSVSEVLGLSDGAGIGADVEKGLVAEGREDIEGS